MNENTKFGSNKVFKSGGPDLPEPIKVKVKQIYDVFKVRFFKRLQHKKKRNRPCDFRNAFFRKLKKNTKELLKRYPKLKNATPGKGGIFNKTKVVDKYLRERWIFVTLTKGRAPF